MAARNRCEFWEKGSRGERRRRPGRVFVGWLLFVTAFSATGCQSTWRRLVPPATVFEVADHRDPSNTRRYEETFDEGYYDMDNHGNVNIVLRQSASAGGEGPSDFTQVVHIRSVWRPIPGRTVAHRTQINAVVSYYLRGGQVGDTLEGAGAVFFNPGKKDKVLKGTLDDSVLRFKRQLAPGEPLFPHVKLSGRFAAVRDRRQVVRIVNDLDRAFGPLPPHVEAK